jgi:hypothetical protein
MERDCDQMRRESLQEEQAPSEHLTSGLLIAVRQRLVPVWLALALTTSVYAEGPTPPVAPADPKSQDDCRDYQRKHNEYLKATEKQYAECQASASKSNSSEFVNVELPCQPGSAKATTYKQCAGVSVIAWCATIGFAEKYGECMKQALAAERKPIDDAVAKNDERRSKEADKLLRDTCKQESALPKPDACKTLEPSGSGLDDLMKH